MSFISTSMRTLATTASVAAKAAPKKEISGFNQVIIKVWAIVVFGGVVAGSAHAMVKDGLIPSTSVHSVADFPKKTA